MDFDEDGDLDIALALEVHDNVVCYNNGGGDFNSGLGCVPTTEYNSYPYNAQEVVAADIDGDGHQDLIYANGGNTGLPLSQPNVLCWGFGSAGVDCHEFGTDAPSTGLAVGDFDGDGDKDVIVSNRGADNEVCLFNGRGQFSVNFDCRPMPASVYDAYVQINGVWTLVTNTVNPIPPTLSNAVALGKIGFTYNVAPDALLDVAFANDGTNVVCLGNGNWAGTAVGFTCRELPETTSYGADSATAHAVDVAIGEISPTYNGDEIVFANDSVGNVMCTNGNQCRFAFHPNLPAHQVWWAAGNQYVTSAQEPDHQPATGIAIRDIDFLQAGSSGRYPNDVVVATLGTSRSFMRADCCTTSNFVTANATLSPSSVTLSGGTVGPPVDGPPSFFGANNVTTEATGPSGAAASFTVTAIDNEDGSRPVSCLPASGSVFAIGNTTVTCTSSDTTGHTATTTLMVTVRDTTGPVVTVPANFVHDATPGLVTTTIAFATSASDLVDGSVEVTCAVGSVGVTAGYQFPGGTTTLDCFARDSRLNYGNASFSITVRTDIDNDGIRDDVDTDDDGDGIADVVDPQSTVASSGYASTGTNSGTVTRNNWTVMIAPTPSGSAYSLRATLSGAGTAPAVITAYCGGVNKQLRLDTAGESIDWRCEAQAPSLLERTLAVKFVSGTPEFWKYSCGLEYQGAGLCGYYQITGAVNNAVSAGSPVTADPSNTEPIEVAIYNSAGATIGSITLEPGESVDVQEVEDPNGGANLLQLELINGGTDGKVTVTLFNQPQTLQMGNGPATFSTTQTVFASGTAAVTAWDPIFPASAYSNWQSLCTAAPAVGLNANWVNPHGAYSFPIGSHPWEFIAPYNFSANWINAWDNLSSRGPIGPDGRQNWTKYSTEVTGEGEFVVQFLADNCSWIYVDGQLVGVQDVNWQTNGTGRYPVTLTGPGPHTLSFIILDGGGAAGGKFRLETRQSFIDNGGDPDGLPEKAPSTTTVSFGDGPFVYTGSPFIATSSVSPDGEAAIVYSGDCVNVGNTCTATATFEGSGTHFASTATASITIVPAQTVTSVSFGGASFVYTGSALQATASAGATIAYSGSCTNVGTCTATATNPGDANHSESSASATAE
ncbi:MAG: hypothetical protein RLZZ53_1334, partial [Acidobacteriota bacterium]